MEDNIREVKEDNESLINIKAASTVPPSKVSLHQRHWSLTIDTSLAVS